MPRKWIKSSLWDSFIFQDSPNAHRHRWSLARNPIWRIWFLFSLLTRQAIWLLLNQSDFRCNATPKSANSRGKTGTCLTRDSLNLRSHLTSLKPPSQPNRKLYLAACRALRCWLLTRYQILHCSFCHEPGSCWLEAGAGSFGNNQSIQNCNGAHCNETWSDWD